MHLPHILINYRIQRDPPHSSQTRKKKGQTRRDESKI
jgi:hypothetical protein